MWSAHLCIFLTTHLLIALCAAASPSASDAFTSFSRTFTGFKTEPTFQAEKFHVSRLPLNQSDLAPGYLFLDPLVGSKGWGPQIYNVHGSLVWHGPTRRRSQNLHVCDYIGQEGSHLCYSRRTGRRKKLPKKLYPNEPRPKSVYPWSIVVNQSYDAVGKIFKKGFDGLSMNVHGFETVDSGYTFVTIVGRPTTVDLTLYGGDAKGWVLDQCLDEIDIQSAKSIYHWCYLESGLPIWETDVFFTPKGQHWWNAPFRHSPNATTGGAGDGDVYKPWDFLHINAVNKDKSGNYYVSVRHADQILKIAGKDSSSGQPPGTILWKLGGKSNEFKLDGWSFDRPFSKQHDVRPIYSLEGGDEEVISLFNNAFEGTIPASQPYSDAQIIRIDSKRKHATLLRSYPHPGKKLTQGRGSTQQLANGNVLVSWGDLGEITEFDADGRILYHASFQQAKLAKNEFSYRAFKSPWHGKPATDPKLIISRERCNGTTIRLYARPKLLAYVSWNGATEVVSWRFSISRSQKKPDNSSWIDAGEFKMHDFETVADLTSAAAGIPEQAGDIHVLAEGIDIHGGVLGSVVAKGVVDDGCMQRYTSALMGLIIIILVIEIVVYAWRCWLSGRSGNYVSIPSRDATAPVIRL